MAEPDSESESAPLHLAVVGGGVAGCAAASWAATRGVRVTLFNAGLPLGGSCIHAGTFPARTMMSVATDHHRAEHPRFSGLHTNADPPDFAKIHKAQRQMGHQIQQRYFAGLEQHDNVEIIEHRAAFADEHTLEAGGQSWQPDRIVLAPGSQSRHPDIAGIDKVSALNLEQLAELTHLPEKMVFYGSNDVTLAFVQALARFGTSVTLLSERPGLFKSGHGDDVVEAMTEVLSNEGVEVVTDVDVTEVESHGDDIRVYGDVDGTSTHWSGRHLVIVDHRRPRIEQLRVDRAGIELTADDFLKVDESLQTTNERVFAAGDAVGRREHAYAAAYDATLAARNAISPSRTAGHPTAVPFAIYTDPQLAGVGWTEPRARDAGFLTDVATCHLQNIPAGHALGEKQGFIKLIRDQRSDHLVGAHLLAANASDLIMELALAVRYGLTVSELAGLVHPPISLGQAIAAAARQFIERQPGTARRPTSGAQ